MDVDAERLARALRAAHGCGPSCRGCRREQQLVRGPGLARFRHVVTGPLALRLWHAKEAYGIPIPSHAWTDDPLERWLIEEAVMTYSHEAGRQEAQHEQARTDARSEADRLLAEHREQQGYG